LEKLYLHDNQFTDLPDLSPDTALTDLEIQNNQFTFEDIEPNIGLFNFIYSPLDSIGEEQDTTIDQGSLY
jgi:Leucine-rich repeat (LRR) protein